MAAGTRVQLCLGERVVAEVAFSGDELRVGRMKENDLVINNLAVSRFHAVLRRVGDAFELEDLGSENGSFIDRIAVRGSAVVPSGASITIGKHTLRIRDGGERPAQAPAPGRSDVWDVAQTVFAPELAPPPGRADDDELAMEAELIEDEEVAAAAPSVAAGAPAEASAGASRPRGTALDLPDLEGLFAFGEDELAEAAVPAPRAPDAGPAVAGPIPAVRPQRPNPAPAAATAGGASETGSQTGLFDFGADDLGISDRSLARSAARAVAPAPKLEPKPGPSEVLHAGLIVARSGRVERVVACDGAELVAGRAPNCRLVLAGAGVSRRHARFVRAGDRLEVTDLDSANGLRVNGEPTKTRSLAAGDVVAIDDYTLTFVLDREPVDGVVRASATPPDGAAEPTVLAEASGVAIPERDLVIETDAEDAGADWEKELERSGEPVSAARMAAREGTLEIDWKVEVAIATERLPAPLRRALEALREDELRLPAELRFRRRGETKRGR